MTNVTCEKDGCSESFDPEATGVIVDSVEGNIREEHYYHSVAHVE